MYIIGIDFGTSTSEVAIYEDDKPILIKNSEEGEGIIVPSVVLIEGDNIKIGTKAKNQMIMKPFNTINEVKKYIGTDKVFEIDNKIYSAVEIASMIIKKMKQISEFYLGEEIFEAVITVPANFNDIQRNEIKKAGKLAGLEVKRIINEPTSAAIAYGFNKKDENMNLLVYDFGGGTFDVTVLELFNGVLNVKASRGKNIGGDKIDALLYNYVLNKIQEEKQLTIDTNNLKVVTSISVACEECKRNLTFDDSYEILIPYIAKDKDNNIIDFSCIVTVEEFNNLISPLVKETIDTVDEVLSAAQLSDNEIDKVILVGGTSRIPYIKSVLEQKYGVNKLEFNIDPEEVVAKGAAIQGAIKNGNINKSIIVTDATSHSLGVEVFGGYYNIIIPRDSKLPIKATKRYRTIEDGQTDIEVRIFQGESKYINENTFLYSFELNNIPSKPKGEELIDITFKYDLDGILEVEASSLSTDLSKNISLKCSNGIDKFELPKEEDNIEIEDNSEIKEEVEEDYSNIYEEIVKLINYVNAILPQYSFDVQSNAREIMKDMISAIRSEDYALIRNLESNIISLLELDIET